MKHKILSVALLTGACAMAANADSVKASQSIQLTPGWNAVYLTVAPTNTPDAFFAEWPVDFVAAYDQAAFLETKQYSASNTTEGVQKSGYRIWHRGDPGATSLHGLAANTVYLCFATNAMKKTVFGVPRAPRISWHASAADGTRNLVGISVWQETAVSNYFAGVDAGCSEYKQFYGKDAAQPKQGRCSVGEKLGMGNVLVVDATKVSDWSGALYVSPMTGIDFGTNATLAALSVRNDGATSRNVCVALKRSSGAEIVEIPPGLKIKNASTVLGSSDWQEFQADAAITNKLEAGETLTLSLALDRTNTNFTKKVAGAYCGGLLEITDVDGGSNMRVVVPVEATSDGGASAKTAWPAGVWILSAELNEASYVNAAIKGSAGITNVAAGGTMKVRLPMAVDGKGKMTLLQRLWYGYDSNGVMRVIAGSPANGVTLYSARRISTAFLPTDQVEIAATDKDSVFGKVATFQFTVGERSNVNPMRHALHPNHDGLDFDFKDPSPSGDDLDNYVGSVKPETFSITNTVELTWTAGEGGAAWSPEETLTGVLKWAFGGLRHEGTIQAQGPFVMKRITSANVE